MRRILFLCLAMPVMLLQGYVEPLEHRIVIENPIAIDRADEPVTIPRADLVAWFGSVPKVLVPIVISSSGDTIPSQADDLTGDGSWDELFFLANIPANGTLEATIAYVRPNALPKYTHRSQVWLASPQEDGSYVEVKEAQRPNITRANHGQTKRHFQFEGPGWENDLLGFRIYFDERNGIDIFGKTTPEMVLQGVGIDQDYHQIQEWGMDILKVGKSLGAGSLALVNGDVLHRVAVPSKGDYRLVANGPLRSIFRLGFAEWEVGGETYALEHEVSIWGGAWYYHSKVTLTEGAPESTIATGITTIDLKDDTLFVDKSLNNVVLLATHDQQAIEGEYLGMAIMLSKENFMGYGKAPDRTEGDGIDRTYYAKMPITVGGSVDFRFYSCWELSDARFADRDYFLGMLAQEAMRMNSPLVIRSK